MDEKSQNTLNQFNEIKRLLSKHSNIHLVQQNIFQNYLSDFRLCKISSLLLLSTSYTRFSTRKQFQPVIPSLRLVRYAITWLRVLTTAWILYILFLQQVVYIFRHLKITQLEHILKSEKSTFFSITKFMSLSLVNLLLLTLKDKFVILVIKETDRMNLSKSQSRNQGLKYSKQMRFSFLESFFVTVLRVKFIT